MKTTKEIIKQINDMKYWLGREWTKMKDIDATEEARISGQIQGLNTAIEIIKTNLPLYKFLKEPEQD